MNKARVIAYYLPQFHPIPENDENWGKGFTEWTNVANAKPLWRGHHQPRIPKDLGFYDLRLQETRIAQAEMAREAGVEDLCIGITGSVVEKCCLKSLWNGCWKKESQIFRFVLDGPTIVGQIILG